MDWYQSAVETQAAKRSFHLTAKKSLRALAQHLGFPPESYDLRANPGGIAVAGEITLHHDSLYVQVCQSFTGAERAILIRSCQGRKDYVGGRNHFVSIALLDDVPTLARHCRAVLANGDRAGMPSRAS